MLFVVIFVTIYPIFSVNNVIAQILAAKPYLQSFQTDEADGFIVGTILINEEHIEY